MMKSDAGTLILKEQECDGTYDASVFIKSEKFMTSGFVATFQESASTVYRKAIDMIMEKYATNADYLQSFVYTENGKETTFWLIVDDYGEGHFVLTALLPSEY